MRSAFAIFAATAFLVAASSGVAFAASPTHEFSGQIARVNSASKTVTVKATEPPIKVMTFSLASDAKITSDAKTTDLAGLKVGQRVVVKYADEGAKHEAVQIDAHARIASAHPAASKPVAKN